MPAVCVHLRFPRRCAADVGGGQSLGLRDPVFEGVFHPLGPLQDQRAIRRMIACIAQRRKRIVHPREVRSGVTESIAAPWRRASRLR